jgi:hypothetical protein
LKSVGVGAIQRPSSVATERHEADGEQHLQMLRDRRLRHLQRVGDVADSTLVGREEVENVAPARLGDGVEHIRVGGCSRHELNCIPISEYVKCISMS